MPADALGYVETKFLEMLETGQGIVNGPASRRTIEGIGPITTCYAVLFILLLEDTRDRNVINRECTDQAEERISWLR